MISFSSKGDFRRTIRSLKKMSEADIFSSLNSYGARGVSALAAATPQDSGRAATSWSYKVVRSSTSWSIIWSNSDIENGFPVVIGLQYGHGTGTGGWVQGQDFINPAIRPIFDEISQDVWKAVTSA